MTENTRARKTMTLNQLLDSDKNGDRTENLAVVFCDAVFGRAGITPAQMTVMHVYLSALRNRDSAIVRADQVRRGELHMPLATAENDVEMAEDDLVTAFLNLCTLCGDVRAEVSISV